MDRQTLRDWVHRFNTGGPEALLDAWTNGPTPRLSSEQMSELAALVDAGPDRQADGVGNGGGKLDHGSGGIGPLRAE